MHACWHAGFALLFLIWMFDRLIDLDYFMFARKSTLVNQAADSSSVVSIQLSLGSFMTSSIYLSLLESRSLTWRTRIVSAQGM